MWCVEGTHTLNIVQFIVIFTHSVNYIINRIHNEDLRVGGNK